MVTSACAVAADAARGCARKGCEVRCAHPTQVPVVLPMPSQAAQAPATEPAAAARAPESWPPHGQRPPKPPPPWPICPPPPRLRAWLARCGDQASASMLKGRMGPPLLWDETKPINITHETGNPKSHALTQDVASMVMCEHTDTHMQVALRTPSGKQKLRARTDARPKLHLTQGPSLSRPTEGPPQLGTVNDMAH